MGFHAWQVEPVLLRTRLDNSPIDPVLSFIDQSDGVVQVGFDDFVNGSVVSRGVPVKRIATDKGEVLVATGFDIMMSQFGHSRGLEGAFATSYDDEDAPYTPAWQERHTGIGRETAIRFAREFATNAELTNGKSMVIVGASANHWYYNNLCYRSATVASDPVRLLRRQRRWYQPLRRSGKACSRRALEHDCDGARLDQAAAGRAVVDLALCS